ncbi:MULTISPECIES: biotin/lipoyl-binding protein [unclassified Paenibacillus]|uniref:efflux RND transporter periplasmic adaptor subunit n=1 Tax=unclassified Paenibacillus TaxID=185978 RepID=UPI00104B0B83|nr:MULTISPECIES: biotin/lipoyl-binding protein [unclassified Paenibacillus]NIK68488.1 macrolide-specific efflux system membrane fusion protein [Paenibacillus sp. BK720]TCM99225.1 macrolide-specific efflux system membrane fusion protein [Paenibacillus sp. BK033]
MSMKWWTGNLYKRSAAVMIAASVLMTSGCSLLPDEPEEEVLPSIAPPQISKKPEYEVTTATLETKVQVIGKMISQQEETLYFTLDGMRLKELNIKAGDQVKAGQTIGVLDVELMQKDLRNQKLAFRREETAMKEALQSKDEMDPIEFEEKSIAFEEKKQALADLEEQISRSVLTAPFSGTVVTLNVQKGDLIKAYDPIAVIADTSLLVPAAKLTKDEQAKIAVGMPVVVDINNAGQFKGTVKALPVTSTDSNNGGGNGGGGGQQPERERPEDFMIIQVKDLPKTISRGTPLSINVITKRKENVVVIPPSTLRTIGSRTYVQVVDAEGKREVDVEVGQQTATQIEIIKGLTPGQKVVGK